jgi:hypothetical protein
VILHHRVHVLLVELRAGEFRKLRVERLLVRIDVFGRVEALLRRERGQLLIGAVVILVAVSVDEAELEVVVSLF